MSRPQRKGPLRKIVTISPWADSDLVTLECGHRCLSTGIYAARCRKCGEAALRAKEQPK